MSTDNSDDRVIVDHAGIMSGRGAWLHPSARCLREAVKRRAFSRALRLAGVPDVSMVEDQIRWFDHHGQNKTGSKEQK